MATKISAVQQTDKTKFSAGSTLTKQSNDIAYPLNEEIQFLGTPLTIFLDPNVCQNEQIQNIIKSLGNFKTCSISVDNFERQLLTLIPLYDNMVFFISGQFAKEIVSILERFSQTNYVLVCDKEWKINNKWIQNYPSGCIVVSDAEMLAEQISKCLKNFEDKKALPKQHVCLEVANTEVAASHSGKYYFLK
jgi:hypothetical protein